MSYVSLQQYPVGDSHNINNGMRAADGSGDTLVLQEKAPSRGMRYLVNIQKWVSCCHKKHITTYSYAYTLKQGRAEKRRPDMHPWIYGSRVSAWIGPFSALQYLQQMGLEAKARATEEYRVNTTTCMPGTYDKKIFIDDVKAILIPTQVSWHTGRITTNHASIRSKLDDAGVERTAY